jgi:hypothetical protein
MTPVARSILRFPCASAFSGRGVLRESLLRGLRVSEFPVIVDFSHCASLNSQDIELLLECVAQVAGRDTKVLFVAGSRVNRVILEVTRISSLVPVFNTVEEALAHPGKMPEDNADAIDEDEPTGGPSVTQSSLAQSSVSQSGANESCTGQSQSLGGAS